MINTTTIMVPTNPKPSIFILPSGLFSLIFTRPWQVQCHSIVRSGTRPQRRFAWMRFQLRIHRPWRTFARQFMLATMRTGLADRRSGARGVQPSNMHKLHVEVPDLQPSSLLLRGSTLAHTGMSQNAKGSRPVSVCLMSQGAEALPGRCAFR